MKIRYTKLDPTGNTTILVDSPVPRERQGAVAAALLARPDVGGEQVGYIEAPANPEAAVRLQMMGGEFCGNAAMSLGALMCRVKRAATLEALLEVSGIDELVPCRVSEAADGRWTGTVRMPLPSRMGTREIDTDAGPLAVTCVELPGIAHLLIPSSAKLDEAQLRRRLPAWNAGIGADALGALTWNEAAMSIDPLVYVPSADTLVREHGCGSGSAAVACWLAHRDGKNQSVDVRQSGGTIRAEAALDATDALSAVTITGCIALVDEGVVEIDA